jgi:hypothetical protein
MGARAAFLLGALTTSCGGQSAPPPDQLHVEVTEDGHDLLVVMWSGPDPFTKVALPEGSSVVAIVAGQQLEMRGIHEYGAAFGPGFVGTVAPIRVEVRRPGQPVDGASFHFGDVAHVTVQPIAFPPDEPLSCSDLGRCTVVGVYADDAVCLSAGAGVFLDGGPGTFAQPSTVDYYVVGDPAAWVACGGLLGVHVTRERDVDGVSVSAERVRGPRIGFGP